MGRLLRLIWLTILLANVCSPVSAQNLVERLITPGPLASAHAKLESKCDSCHASFGKEAQNSRCNACHKGVASDIRTRTGYHGKFAPARTQNCKSCHSDHHGRGYTLIKFSRTGFNHDLTDYPLRGGHAQVSCTSCHGSGNNYRGIATQCVACHKTDDPHKGALGRSCDTCHAVDGWKQTKPFNHTSTGFRLTGAHAAQGCLSCHKGQVWKGLGTSCISCHAGDDTHRGSRGRNCESCHTTGSWRQLTFDHDSTGFSLVGGHARASCAGCHGPGNTTKKPGRTCIGCHQKDDTHKGGNGTECAACHTPTSWKSIRFDHDRLTDFPLRGAHKKAVCRDCHVQPAKTVPAPTTCYGCHQADDDHKGGNGQDCGRCHNENAWDKVDFVHDTMTRFPLTGKHAQASCESCHASPPDEVKLSLECGSCHAKDDVHAGSLGQSCARCHDTTDWAGKVRFDHDLSRFPLLGKHAGLDCTQCHADQSFKAKGITCSSCHADDFHKGAFGTPSNCRDCHNTTDWKAWTFDHDRRTDFALTGKHDGLVCSACHARAGDPGDLGTACSSCHKRDDVHSGRFGEECAACHVTSEWNAIILPKRR